MFKGSENMVNKISDLVTGEAVIIWLIIAFLVGYFIYKEWPEFKKRVSKGEVKEKTEEMNEKTVSERLDDIERKLTELDEKTDKRLTELGNKLAHDYDRINSMEREQKEYKKMQRSSLEERGLIMRALLALMECSPDNEKIKQSEQEITNYLVRQSHQDI